MHGPRFHRARARARNVQRTRAHRVASPARTHLHAHTRIMMHIILYHQIQLMHATAGGSVCLWCLEVIYINSMALNTLTTFCLSTTSRRRGGRHTRTGHTTEHRVGRNVDIFVRVACCGRSCIYMRFSVYACAPNVCAGRASNSL